MDWSLRGFVYLRSYLMRLCFTQDNGNRSSVDKSRGMRTILKNANKSYKLNKIDQQKDKRNYVKVIS